MLWEVNEMGRCNCGKGLNSIAIMSANEKELTVSVLFE